VAVADQDDLAAARRDLLDLDAVFSNHASGGASMITGTASSISAIGPCFISPAA
jgi:hypothetical protein